MNGRGRDSNDDRAGDEIGFELFVTSTKFKINEIFKSSSNRSALQLPAVSSALSYY